MKTGFVPVIIFCAVFLAIFNTYKSVHFFNNNDFPYDARNIYLAGIIWLKKLNPYNDSLIKNEWIEISKVSNFISLKKPGFPQCGMIYPFWSIPMLFIYFTHNWLMSRVIIWIISFLLLSAIIFFAHNNFSQFGYKWWQILLFILCFKSTITALILGQPMLLSMAAIMAMWYFYHYDKKLISGFLLGIAYSKVTLCLPFIIFFAVNKNWKILFVSLIFPILSSIVFYIISGNLYIYEMLNNIKQQMNINYAGHSISSINTNLTELGILLNYFAGTSYMIIEKFNILSLILSYIILTIYYKNHKIDSYKYIALLILCNFLFSYHLIYDCILLLFILPTIKNRILALFLSIPLFLPLNGLFKDASWLHFHLPVVIMVLMLYVLFEENLKNKFSY
ncbi:MAG: DUF2029 domain-containing protein [Bacteroidia bacterium]|nr:DUF2029 domain-containing protein [Bacteroidia bacterium]